MKDFFLCHLIGKELSTMVKTPKNFFSINGGYVIQHNFSSTRGGHCFACEWVLGLLNG
jgi:hypothetical protein